MSNPALAAPIPPAVFDLTGLSRLLEKAEQLVERSLDAALAVPSPSPVSVSAPSASPVPSDLLSAPFNALWRLVSMRKTVFHLALDIRTGAGNFRPAPAPSHSLPASSPSPTPSQSSPRAASCNQVRQTPVVPAFKLDMAEFDRLMTQVEAMLPRRHSPGPKPNSPASPSRTSSVSQNPSPALRTHLPP